MDASVRAISVCVPFAKWRLFGRLFPLVAEDDLRDNTREPFDGFHVCFAGFLLRSRSSYPSSVCVERERKCIQSIQKSRLHQVTMRIATVTYRRCERRPTDVSDVSRIFMWEVSRGF